MSTGGKTCDGADRISALPDELIDHILSFVNDIDAVVRTSVLSKRWTCCWKRVTKLDFDLKRLETNVRRKALDLSIKKRQRRSLDVAKILESIFSRHEGPIYEFFLSLKEPRGRYLDVTRWLKMLSKKEIRKISISVQPGCIWRIPKTPPEIWNASALTHLVLRYCDFRSGPIQGFPNLICLSLHSCSMSIHLLENIISGSPLLLELKLKCMDIFYGDRVTINAPRLKSLTVKTDFKLCLRESSLTYAKFEHYPRVYSIKVYQRDDESLDGFVRTMPRIEKLVLDDATVSIYGKGDTPMRLPTTLPRLHSLEFKDFNVVRSALPGVFALIRSSPNLQSLSFHVSRFKVPNYELENLDVLFEAQKKGGVLSYLPEVTFVGVLGSKYENLFIATIIKLCPSLTKINIRLGRGITPDKEGRLRSTVSNLVSESTTIKWLNEGED